MAAHDNSPSNIVSISRIVSVRPKVVQSERILSLSNLDRQCPTLMHLVFFYDLSSSHSHEKDNCFPLDSVFSSLKSGLEETLTLWYPGAGRLRMNQSDGKLNLWCNNQGAVMAEAGTSVKISQLGNLSEYSEFFEKLVYKPPFDGDFQNMPLIVAQVTRFGCGGYSIGIGTSHSLFDGPATYEFLYAWASNSEIGKGIPIRRSNNNELPKPVHERGILLISPQAPIRGALNIIPSNSSFNNAKQVRGTVAIDHLYQLIMQAAASSGQKGFLASSNQNKSCFLKTYHLSGAMVDDLKRKFLPMRTGSPHFSTFEVLAAHLWKARTKALSLSKQKQVCLQFAMDARNKTLPPLQKFFSGNAYVLASVMMSVEHLEQASHEAVIEKIREAKNAVNHDYVKAYLGALEGSNANSSLPPLKELTLVSDWTRMPFHNIQFFQGKTASYVCPLATPVPQVAYFMQSPCDIRGVDVRIGFEAEILSAFSNCFLSIGQ